MTKKKPKKVGRVETPEPYRVCLVCFGGVGHNCVCPPRPGHDLQQRIDGAIVGWLQQQQKPDGRSLRLHRK